MDYKQDTESKNQVKHGGKRSGAGRPSTGRTTKVVRVPLDYPDVRDVKVMIKILKQWKENSDKASPKSVRWVKLRELLNDLPESIFDNSDAL